MIQEFKEFIAKGNIVQLAVAFVMGVTFASVVTTFTDRIINPIIAWILPGIDNLDAIGTFADNGSIGAFIGALIYFVIVAFILFLIVKAFNRWERKEEEAPATPSEEIVLLTEIRDSLRR